MNSAGTRAREETPPAVTSSKNRTAVCERGSVKWRSIRRFNSRSISCWTRSADLPPPVWALALGQFLLPRVEPVAHGSTLLEFEQGLVHLIGEFIDLQ